MNRRRLILTSLGALAALPLGSQVLKFISAEVPPPPEPHNWHVASLFVGVSANTTSAERQLNAFEGAMRRQATRLESTGTDITARGAPLALVGGELLITTEAEGDTFLLQMADVIMKSSDMGFQRPA